MSSPGCADKMAGTPGAPGECTAHPNGSAGCAAFTNAVQSGNCPAGADAACATHAQNLRVAAVCSAATAASDPMCQRDSTGAFKGQTSPASAAATPGGGGGSIPAGGSGKAVLDIPNKNAADDMKKEGLNVGVEGGGGGGGSPGGSSFGSSDFHMSSDPPKGKLASRAPAGIAGPQSSGTGNDPKRTLGELLKINSEIYLKRCKSGRFLHCGPNGH